MSRIENFLKALNLPASIWRQAAEELTLKFKQGGLSTATMQAIITAQPTKPVGFLRHSSSLYSCVIQHQDQIILLGPTIITDVSQLIGQRGQVLFLPRFLNTASLTTEQFCYQVLTLLELAATPLPLATIKAAFQAAAFANTFGAKFTNLQFTADANHVNYYYERAVKKAIAQGDIAALPTIFKNNLNSGRVGVLAENDELRSVKNWAIISVSVNLRAFFTVGMDYEMAYSLNDQYVRDIERLQSQHEVLAAIERIDVDMATRCKTLLSAKMTAPISKVFWRLMKDPTTAATIADLARAVDLSTQYLGTSFKKQVGVSINQFRQLCRINYAIEDLLDSDLAIGEIAAKYDFADQAHFSRVFHHWTGVSPKAAQQDRRTITDWNLYDYLFQPGKN